MATLTGKAAVVTGGSRGIGRAVVLRLARDGASVVFNYARSRDAADDVVRQAEKAGGNVAAVRLDLAEAGAAEELPAIAERRLGALDILVNNAAVHTEAVPLAQTTEADFDRVMAVNAKSVFLTVRYAARHMRDGGRIVNISTLNTVFPAPGNGPYAASKGALEQLTLVASRELGARGITVNAVSPGATDTDLLNAANEPEKLAMAVAMTSLGRLGRPEDVADVVAFLAGPDGRWVTGQNIRANGGVL
ncbi:SDR family oxidoreductase [Streptomyces sp. NPDC059209]|uniref:SDR family oxidoreductase n=1 Tax=Streptomyces sp. NPDC059209 TaxID=3346769 RepID=UPI0036C43CFD